MIICSTAAELDQALLPHRASGAGIGFVPTMGALHEGHLSLVRRARRDDDVVVVSIFVNPLQFGPQEDLARYPRPIERDRALLEAEAVDVLFLPVLDEMYPSGFATRVEVGEIGEVFEGASRPGHFSGVATVVLKLLNLVRPTRAYFGQKDAQQVAVIRRMVRDLNLPVEIVRGPTVREPDGLALSSRNVYLSPDERRAAPVLYHALTAAGDLYQAGERSADRLRDCMAGIIAAEPLARLDYADVVDGDTMRRRITVTAGDFAVVAAHFGTTRLIDNLELTSSPYPSAALRTGLPA